MIIPGIIAVAAPIVMGVIFGTGALGGMLAGALVTGVLMAIFMANAGGAWHNAKKYPFKDTSGPSINILIKLMTIVSLVFAPLFLLINNGAGLF